MAALRPHALPANRRIAGRAAKTCDRHLARNPAPAVILLRDRPGAGELKHLLLPMIESGEPVSLDASAVEKLPMPALQVILSAAATLQRRGADLTIRNATFTFTQAFEVLGFTGDLRLTIESRDLAPNPMGRPALAEPQAAEPVIAITIQSEENYFERAIDIRNILAGLEGFGELAVTTSLARLPALDQLDSALCFLDFTIALKSQIAMKRVGDYLALQLGQGSYGIALGTSSATFPPPRHEECDDVYWHHQPVPTLSAQKRLALTNR